MARVVFSVIFFSSFLGLSTGVAEGKRDSKVHVVERGQTLWSISREYGCKLDLLQQANDLERATIRPGQKLRIPKQCSRQPSGKSGSSGSERLVLTHYVMKGDTLGGIAKRYDTTVQKIRTGNRLTGDIIRPGQKLRIEVGTSGKGRAIAGQSVGSARDGRLINGMQLPPGKSYYRRRPNRAWGANHTIYHIRRAASLVRSRFPKVHKLAIGDISARKGGKLAQHKSHQSGRDADIGLYFKKRPEGYPRSFIKATKDNLDLAATWALIEAFAETASSPTGVEKMFLDYALQKALYEYAKKRGVSKRKLDTWFQYPHGKSAARGLIRDDPGHDSHVHVRFKCPKGDKACRS